MKYQEFVKLSEQNMDALEKLLWEKYYKWIRIVGFGLILIAFNLILIAGYYLLRVIAY